MTEKSFNNLDNTINVPGDNRMIDQFTNRYSLSKTLRFSLEPVGETENHFRNRQMLKTDEQRASDAEIVKGYLKDWFKVFIDRVLKQFANDTAKVDSFNEKIKKYSETLRNNNYDDDDDDVKKIEDELRKLISDAFVNDDSYKPYFKNSDKIADFINKQILKDKDVDDDKKKDVAKFKNFYTYFSGFFTNIKNMFTADEKNTAIAYRCINVNLPLFNSNIKVYNKVKGFLLSEIDELNTNFSKKFDEPSFSVEKLFDLEFFSSVLSQEGIDNYNSVIGGFTKDDITKIKGLNEYINLYNQTNEKKLPFMCQLKKQILSDSDSFSFIPEKFEDDDKLIKAVKNSYCAEDGSKNDIKSAIDKLYELINNIDQYDVEGIFISADEINNLSRSIFNDRTFIKSCWDFDYDSKIKNRVKKKSANKDDIDKKRDEKYKKIKSFSIAKLQELIKNYLDNFDDEELKERITKHLKEFQVSEDNLGKIICFYLKLRINALKNQIEDSYDLVKYLLESEDQNEKKPGAKGATGDLLESEHQNEKKLQKDDEAIAKIKLFFDSIKDFENLVKMLTGSQKEPTKDDGFYGDFIPNFDSLRAIDGLYNKVRNYLTAKPYSTEKIKLNFEDGNFLSGWSSSDNNSKYGTKDAIFVLKGNDYYLAIIDKKLDKKSVESLSQECECEEDRAQRIVYYLQTTENGNLPRLLIRSKKPNYAPVVGKFNLPVESIIELYDKGWYKTEYEKENPEVYKESLTKLIDYFKLGISKHESLNMFDVPSHKSNKYGDIKEFYADAQKSFYKLIKENINFKELVKLANQGKLYLFKINNKDFSENSKGNPNLHTLYFKMLFDERNLNDVVYKLSGRAEMFYRKKSIEDGEKVTHPEGQAIPMRHKHDGRETSEFIYPITKDRRYTVDKFFLHVPIKLNFKANGTLNLNADVKEKLKESDKVRIIGIDRGERNLVYICVIDENGKIIEQRSLNTIKSDNDYEVGYNGILTERAKNNYEARRNWKTIQGIKNIKEGYLSQVVHEICNLVVKHDAIIALEDLDDKFRRGRLKVEKQVYKKFENMLISKLQYLVTEKPKTLADADVMKPGGLLNAYQLSEGVKKESYHTLQNGIVFYVPAAYTSKIDPVTGFVNIINTEYKSVKKARELIENFDAIRYISDGDKGDMFEFDIDYNKFPEGNSLHKKNWTVCTNGERIKRFKNKQGIMDSEEVNLTKEFRDLFDFYDLNYKEKEGDLKEKILNKKDSEFFKEFLRCLSLTLQMRNTDDENDCIISPVRDANGEFYDSRIYKETNSPLPRDADANGAYNIARKALYLVNKLKNSEDLNHNISYEEWFKYAQTFFEKNMTADKDSFDSVQKA